MVIESLSEFVRNRAINAASKGDMEPAKVRQRELLGAWAGRSVTLDLPVIKPEDCVQGVWDSLRQAGIVSPVDSNTFGVVTASGKKFYQDGQTDPYAVPATYHHILMRPNEDHLRGLVMDLVFFTYRGEEYLRVFRQYCLEGEGKGRDTAPFLYRRDQMRNGIWAELGKRDVPTSDVKWLLEERQTEDFLLRAGRNYVRSNAVSSDISVERFQFEVQPKIQDPTPITPQRPVLPLFRRAKAA